VRTDREVTIVEDRSSLSGRGMEYNTESRQFTLTPMCAGVSSEEGP